MGARAYERKKPPSVYADAGSKKRVFWYDYFNAAERAFALLRHLKATRSQRAECTTIVMHLVEARWTFNSSRGRLNTRELARYLLSNVEAAAAFDTACRLQDAKKATVWLMRTFEAQLPKPSVEELEEAARQAKEARTLANVQRREAHARAMLLKHEQQLRREIKLVRKWRSKVRYYDRKVT